MNIPFFQVFLHCGHHWSPFLLAITRRHSCGLNPLMRREAAAAKGGPCCEEKPVHVQFGPMGSNGVQWGPLIN